MWRSELAPGLNRLGGPGCEVEIPGTAGSELHLWDDPPRLVHVGGQTRPEFEGRAVEELDLVPGARFTWAGHEFVFGSAAPRAALQEIPLTEALPAKAPAPSAAGPAPRAWTAVRAGMLAELGLADRQVVQRWQDAVVRGEFDPLAAAQELVRSSPVPEDDPRLAERSARLLRDFLMSSMQRGARGAGRKARNVARTGLAMILAQGLAILAYTLVLFVIALLTRVKWGFSLDRLLDGVAGR